VRREKLRYEAGRSWSLLVLGSRALHVVLTDYASQYAMIIVAALQPEVPLRGTPG
jgi:hypothetical protein